MVQNPREIRVGKLQKPNKPLKNLFSAENVYYCNKWNLMDWLLVVSW